MQQLLEIKYEMNYGSFLTFLSATRDRILVELERLTATGSASSIDVDEGDGASLCGATASADGSDAGVADEATALTHEILFQQLSVLRVGMLMREVLATNSCVYLYGHAQVESITTALATEAESLLQERALLIALGAVEQEESTAAQRETKRPRLTRDAPT